MSRIALPTRRQNLTVATEWNGHAFTVTIGFDPSTGNVAEVFADRPKVDTMQAILSDACIVASIALQHGIAPDALAKSLGRVPAFINGTETEGPASPVGAVMEVVMRGAVA